MTRLTLEQIAQRAPEEIEQNAVESHIRARVGANKAARDARTPEQVAAALALEAKKAAEVNAAEAAILEADYLFKRAKRGSAA